MSEYLVYDIETKKLANEVEGGWGNIHGMGMASGVVWSSKTEEYYFFGPEESEIDRMAGLLNGKVVVTFNGITFDSKLLLGNDRIIEDDGTTKNDKYGWKNVDIFMAMWRQILGHKGTVPELIKAQKKPAYRKKGVYNLDSILWATMRIKKNGNGADAPKLYQEGKMKELLEYNLQDVKCERDLYQFIKKYKYLINGEYDVVTFD